MDKIFARFVWFGDEIARRIVYLAGFFVLVSGAMSWVASYIALIAQYGWGAVVFAGIGIACAIILVASGALVAWRYFNPLRPAAPSEGQKAQGSESHALAMRLNIFGFLTENPSDKGTYKLYLTLKALETICLTRIMVLFNRHGNNGGYQLDDLPHQMLLGQELSLALIHYRPNIGTFWGDLNRVTERVKLDHLTKEEQSLHLKLNLDVAGPHYYCKLVAQHTRGEESMNFTVLVPSRSERPCILTGGADHKEYDPSPSIPATGTFLS